MTLISESEVDKLKESLSQIKNKRDLICILNKVNKLTYLNEKRNVIKFKTLTFLANPKLAKDRYSSFSIVKKSGNKRIIYKPSASLSFILKLFNILFKNIFTFDKYVTGFVNNKSVVDNSKFHINKQFVYNIDLKDFFHSIDRNKIKMALMLNLFKLNPEKEKIAFFLSCLFTHTIEVNNEEKTILPQGSPLSPILSNLVCKPLDRKLFLFSKKYKCTYSRYADDISFSANRNIFKNSFFLQELNDIITSYNFEINDTKTRLQKRGYRQEVTGLIVNEKVNVSRYYLKQIRMWIFYIERYGLIKAELLFRQDYIRQKGHVKNIDNPMISVIQGKLDYLKMVKGADNPTYLKLVSRYNKAVGTKLNIDKVIALWSKKGIRNAMLEFYKLKEVKNKKSFINDILAIKELTLKQKDKISKLLVMEFHTFIEDNQNINLKDLESTENNEKYIDPFSNNGLQQFLRAYNQDPILKFTCHTIDSSDIVTNICESANLDEYDLEVHIKLMKDAFETLEKKYFVNKNTSSLIRLYLTGLDHNKKEGGWSSESITLNWSSPEIIEWSKKNPRKVPNPGGDYRITIENKGFKLKKTLHLKSTTISYFSELTVFFKNLFHIKSDNSLKSILERVNSELVNKNHSIAFSFSNFSETIELFTDVDKLKQTYIILIKLILKICQENQNKFKTPIVVLGFTQGIDNSKEFSIHHTNAPYFLKSVDDQVDRIGSDFSTVINNQINGICDFYIQAKFEDSKFWEINLWNGKEREKKEIESIIGVKYILKFKR